MLPCAVDDHDGRPASVTPASAASTAPGPGGRAWSAPARRRALDLVEHLEHPAGVVDELDLGRWRCRPAPLEAGLEPGEAHDVTGLVGRAELLEPLGGDLAGAAQDVLGEARGRRRSAASSRGSDTPSTGRTCGRTWSHRAWPDGDDVDEVVGLHARGVEPGVDGGRIDAEVLLQGVLDLLAVPDAAGLEADAHPGPASTSGSPLRSRIGARSGCWRLTASSAWSVILGWIVAGDQSTFHCPASSSSWLGISRSRLS